MAAMWRKFVKLLCDTRWFEVYSWKGSKQTKKDRFLEKYPISAALEKYIHFIYSLALKKNLTLNTKMNPGCYWGDFHIKVDKNRIFLYWIAISFCVFCLLPTKQTKPIHVKKWTIKKKNIKKLRSCLLTTSFHEFLNPFSECSHIYLIIRLFWRKSNNNNLVWNSGFWIFETNNGVSNFPFIFSNFTF